MAMALWWLDGLFFSQVPGALIIVIGIEHGSSTGLIPLMKISATWMKRDR